MVWYRGYFEDPEFSLELARQQAKSFGANHIVVGHTSMEGVMSLFEGTIFAVDSSMKLGESGELLLFENGTFLKGDMQGNRHEIPEFLPQ